VGHFDEPQCKVVCPVECIITNPECIETPEQLLAKVKALESIDFIKSDN